LPSTTSPVLGPKEITSCPASRRRWQGTVSSESSKPAATGIAILAISPSPPGRFAGGGSKRRAGVPHHHEEYLGSAHAAAGARSQARQFEGADEIVLIEFHLAGRLWETGLIQAWRFSDPYVEPR
jgi:hypothetical protein